MKINANICHETLRLELIALLRKHTEHLSAIEVLATAAHMVGQIIAMQDQRKISPSDAMDVVHKNIEIGNREMIAETMVTKGSA